MVWLRSQIKSLCMVKIMKNMTNGSISSWRWPMSMVWFSVVSNALSSNHQWPSLDISMTRMEHTLTPNIRVVHNMPLPESLRQIQEFLSMIIHLWSFVPSLSSFTASPPAIAEKDKEFIWNKSYQDAFDWRSTWFAKSQPWITLMSKTCQSSGQWIQEGP